MNSPARILGTLHVAQPKEERTALLEAIDRRVEQRRKEATEDLLNRADRRHNTERRFNNGGFQQ